MEGGESFVFAVDGVGPVHLVPVRTTADFYRLLQAGDIIQADHAAFSSAADGAGTGLATQSS